MAKTALIAGATGLVGGYLLDLLLRDETYDKVKVISRRKLSDHEKLDVIILNDFEKLEEVSERLKADHIYCCLGTTLSKAGSKEAFKKVDYVYPKKLAKITQQNDAEKFMLISALGADKNSKIFYNKVKGEVEEAIWVKDFKEIHIFRPSLLMGPRSEKRVGEDAAKTMYKVFNFIFVGPLKKYKGIHAEQVAKAMLHFGKIPYHGKHIHENKELLSI